MLIYKIIIFVILDSLNFYTFKQHNIKKVLDIIYIIVLICIKDLRSINYKYCLLIFIIYILVNLILLISEKLKKDKVKSNEHTLNYLIEENRRLKIILSLSKDDLYNLQSEIQNLESILVSKSKELKLTKQELNLIKDSRKLFNIIRFINTTYINGNTFNNLSTLELKMLKIELKRLNNNFGNNNGLEVIFNNLMEEINRLL